MKDEGKKGWVEGMEEGWKEGGMKWKWKGGMDRLGGRGIKR